MSDKNPFEKVVDAIKNPEDYDGEPIDMTNWQPSIKVIDTEKFAYYELRTEEVTWPDGTQYTSETAYNHEGDYIGDKKFAEFLAERDIRPEVPPKPATRPRTKDTPCSIGFSQKDGKWYGWSHRAIFGFKVGDVAKQGDCVCSSGWTEECLIEHPDWDVRIKPGTRVDTLEDARRFAIAFADSVG